MELTLTRKQAIVLAGVLIAAGVAWGVKHFCFAPLDEKYFQMDYDRLRSAPADVFIFRPTQYGKSTRTGTIAAQPREGAAQSNPPEIRLLGRNVTALETLALAYQCKPSHIVMPKDVTTNRYDFLVTTPKPYERLQTAVKSKLGYTANWQERETDVWELKVRFPNNPGIRPSTGTTTEWKFIDTKLYWRHAKVSWLAAMMEDLFDKPVLDQTGLTNFYDFAFAWDWRGRRTPADREALTNSLGELGLKLEPDIEPVTMLIVEPAR